jgi:ParB-like nuclease domain
LVLSQSNVRRVKSGISVDELAQDIARRGLLQSLNVRPVLKDGEETGMFEVPAGGRRFQSFSSSKSHWYDGGRNFRCSMNTDRPELRITTSESDPSQK